MWNVVCLFIVITLFLKESLPLRVTGVRVPSYPLRGEDVLLECNYDLQQDFLYSVKWYRDHEEFYRYLPKEDPKKQCFKPEGIRVNLHRSDEHSVLLQSVSLRSSGLFRCEVNAEAPSFSSGDAEALMEVVYLPREGPRITRPFSPNDSSDGFLLLNCTSGRSYPAAELAWYLNDEKVTDPSMLIEYPVAEHAHGLLTSSLGLRLKVERPTHAKCTATIIPGAEDSRREALLLVKSSSISIQPLLPALLFVCILIS